LGLRDFLEQSIKKFENNAKEAGILPEKVVVARYALCTLLDETIASTPWGSGEWGKHSLLVMFHKEASGGEKFFQLLSKLAESPKTNQDLLEFMYICLALGFEGRYRVMDNGKAHLDTLRERLAQILNRERNGYERDLSPRWQAAPFKHTKIFLLFPLWVLSALCGSLLLVVYLSYSFLLNSISDPVFTQIQSIQAKHITPVQTTVLQPSATPLLVELLAREIQDGSVTVRDENGRSIIMLLGDGLFAPGSTAVSEKSIPILERIAEALKSKQGNVQVIGHTDNLPIRSVRFPSNWHLSQERAHSVMQLLNKMGLLADRLSAEGRADAEPIASNSTHEGRAYNRRVEIIVSGAYRSK
jgi:type VI secretion system protein ImpK